MNENKKRRFSTVSVGVWLGPIILIIAVLSFLYAGRNQEQEASRAKVMFIGLDGLEWSIVNPLIGEGRLPNLERLIKEGTSGILMSRPVTNSPVIWTTIATGKKREEHGIVGFFSDGQGHEGRTPYTSADRKVAALWNIMGMEDRTVACLGWWCTWPAEKVNGVMVSAFAPYDAKSLFRRGVHAGDVPERLTWPEELVDEIAPYMVSEDDITHEQLERFVNIENWDDPMLENERFGPSVDYVLPWTIATDLSYVQIMEYLENQADYDLSMIYIQGTDTTGHRFWSFREQSSVLHDILVQFDLAPEREEEYRDIFKDAIDEYYVYADEMVGRILDLIDDETVVVVCSDHGFGPYVGANQDRWTGHTFTGSHRPKGSFILWGPGIRQGKWIGDVDPPYIWDIAPTILAVMGLPLAQDMAGSPIMDVFDARFIQNFHPEFVETYDIDFEAGEKPESVPMSQEYEERLRSLGYIQ